MFCDKCGEQIGDDSAFCKKCGAKMVDDDISATAPPGEATQVTTPMSVMAPPVEAIQQPTPPGETGQKQGVGGFFSSPAGIALVIIIGIAVVAGITLGIIFAVKGGGGGGGDEAVSAATVEVWDDYEKLLEKNSEAFPQITTDPAYLANTVKEIEKTLEDIEEIEEDLEKVSGTGAGGVKAGQLAKALDAYRAYVEKMSELFTALSGANLLDQNTVDKLQDMIAELDKLGDKANELSNDFLADNDQVVAKKVDAPVLGFAAIANRELQKAVASAQEAEKARLAAEKAAAEAAAAEAQKKAAEEAAKQKEQQAEGTIVCPNCHGTTQTPGGTCGVCSRGWVTRQSLRDQGWTEVNGTWYAPDTDW